MNPTVKSAAIISGIVDPDAVNDPEGYDGYETYDKVQHFVDIIKEYYIERTARECLDIAKNWSDCDALDRRIKNHFEIE
jgi:hypothetical protein